MNLQKRVSEISVAKNRTRSECNRLHMRIEKKINISREARNRTLIQLGLLFDITEIRDAFSIELGDDLQREISHLDKAALLAGFLMEAFESISMSEKNKQLWLEKGTRLFKRRHYQQKAKTEG